MSIQHNRLLKMSNLENKKKQQKSLNRNRNLQQKADQKIQSLNDLELHEERIHNKINNLISTCLIKSEPNKAKNSIEVMGIFTRQVFNETSMLKLILTSKKT